MPAESRVYVNIAFAGTPNKLCLPLFHSAAHNFEDMTRSSRCLEKLWRAGAAWRIPLRSIFGSINPAMMGCALPFGKIIFPRMPFDFPHDVIGATY
jgi:hypothetical protein